MAEFVGSRNSSQCRTYTNKLITRFGNIQHSLAFLQQSLPHFEQMLRHNQDELARLMFPLTVVAK